VSYLFPTHKAPHDDCRRFTHYGLTALAKRNGLEVVSLQSKGGIPAFIGQFFVMMTVEGVRAETWPREPGSR
jgi:hypothetical protein